jgi:hypothetical protein
MSATSLYTIAARRSDALTSRDNAVLGFASVQMFSLIYLQKFALGGGTSFQLSVPMLIMFAGVGYMVMMGKFEFAMQRMRVYLLFLGACLLTQSLRGGSITSLLQLALLYMWLTLHAEVTETTYRRIINRFVAFMVVPAIIVLVQYGYQKVTGLSDPISMTGMFPNSIQMSGFMYESHFPWNSPFMRPNGFFFLEPSLVSCFTATAAILETIYSRRPYMIVLMLLATALSIGATGSLMLLVAAPFLLARESPRLVLSLIVIGVLAVGVALALDIPLPLLSRVDEINTEQSSGAGRLLLPALRLIDLMFDPTYLLIGDGAGAVTPAANATTVGELTMNAWPFVKIINEYGLLAMLSFVVFYGVGIVGNFNVALKVALSVVFLFTGGYLLNPPVVELMALLCFMIIPAARKPVNG